MKHVLMIAGETSGDRHAAALARELLKLAPGWKLSGFGGPQMQAAGVELKADLTQHAVVGIWEVLRHLGGLQRLLRKICDFLDREKPDAVVLVDYPGFNLKLAQEAKRRGVPVIYYVSPQIWAWGENRIEVIRRCVDLMIVFFPFEEELYRKAGVPVRWVGHPLLDQHEHVKSEVSKIELFGEYELSFESQYIALLPGSRENEIKKLTPILVGAFKILAGRIPNLKAILFQAPGIPQESYGRLPSDVRITPWNMGLIPYCQAALVASGTATLECALADLPMVIIYQAHPVTWWLGKRLVRLPYVGLVNVVAGRKLVPECLQGNARPETIAEAIYPYLTSEEKRSSLQERFREVRKKLGSPGASQRAAEAIVSLLR
ncbi:MAG: lipid-A-disaccharide synthase [Candidatus Omnitrophica bacterium]|nr:lipid-A-disaccharide synthase [Candidatus Omnitrophota bacterium]